MAKRRYHGSVSWKDGSLHRELFNFLVKRGCSKWVGTLPPIELRKEFARKHRLGMPALNKQLRPLKALDSSGEAWTERLKTLALECGVNFTGFSLRGHEPKIVKAGSVAITTTGDAFILHIPKSMFGA